MFQPESLNHDLFSVWNVESTLVYHRECVSSSYMIDLDTSDTISPTCFLSRSLSQSLFFSPLLSAVLCFPSSRPSLCVLPSATWTIWTGYPRPPTSQLSRMSWGPESKPQALWRRTSHSRTCTLSENFSTVTTGSGSTCFTWWLN